MRVYLRSPLFAGLLLGLATFAQAAIEFEATEVTVRPAPGGSRKLAAEFKFKNTGTEPITLEEVRSGCGCTVPEPPKEPIAPGASGVIPVSYAAGERQGRQTQAITVKTSDGKEFELRLVADLPVRVSFAPRMLVLGKGDAATKSATVTFSDDLPVTLVEATCDNPAFELTEPAKLEDGVLKLSVRYMGEATADARGTVRIRTKTNSGADYTDLVYLRHRP